MRTYLTEPTSVKQGCDLRDELAPGKHTWKLERSRVPGAEYRVTENFLGCLIDYEGLNSMLRGLGYRTSRWDPK